MEGRGSEPRAARRRSLRGPGAAITLAVGVVALLLLSGDPASAGEGRPSVAAPGSTAGPLATGLSVGPPCAGTDCGVPAGAGYPTGLPMYPRPATLGNTLTNWLVANWSGEGMIAEDPQNPLSFVAGSLYQEPGSLNNSTIYNAEGVSGAYASADGGHSWYVQPLPACEFHIADSALAFGPDDHVVYIDMGWGTTTAGCSTSHVSGDAVFATTSDDGGFTWGTPVSLRGNGSFSLDKPWAAVDPVTGEFYAAYTDDGASSQIYLQNSTDNGSHWSSPLELSRGSTDSMRGVELAVDGSGAVDAAWVDQSTAVIQFVRSTNHAHSFSTPVTVATAPTAFASPSPDGFRAYLLPALAVDRSPASAYDGRLYAAWQNGSGGTAGSPSISLAYSSDNGSRWSKPITVNSDSTFEDFQPSIAVDPSGTVYVDWYSESASTGHYRLRAAVSHDGGTSFDPEIVVSDTDSYPSYSGIGNAWWIGDYTDIVADASGARPLWTDARGSQEWYCTSCLWGYDYNISMYTAEIVNVSVTANLPVNLSVNGSVSTQGTWAVGPSGAYGDWLVGQNFSLTAPFAVNRSGTPYYFATWFGNATTAAPTLNGSVTRSEVLHACYTPDLGGVCRSPGAPGFLDLSVGAPNATVRIDGTPIAAPSGTVNLTLAPGAHWANVSAPGFHSLDLPARVTTGNVTSLNASLLPYPGWIAGTVEPAGARVTLDGQAVPVGPGGAFNVTVLPGRHGLNASDGPLYADYANPFVAVETNVTTLVAIPLLATSGTVHGTVTPAPASVTVNGQNLPTSGGRFDLVLLAGFYWFNATYLGYLPASSGPVAVGALSNVSVVLNLSTADGEVEGTVAPAGAALTVDGTAVPVVNGVYDATVIQGVHWVNASAPGFAAGSFPATVTPSAITWRNVSLLAAPGWIEGSVAPAAASLTINLASVALGSGGTFNVSLLAGTYRVEASAPGYLPQSVSVDVQGGVASLIRLTLVPAPAPAAAPASPPYLEVGLVVAIAAGGVAAAVRLRRRHDPPRGSPRPRAPR